MGRLLPARLTSNASVFASAAVAIAVTAACSSLKSAPEDLVDAGEDASSVDSSTSPVEASVETDAGANDAAGDASPAPTVELTMSSACDNPWRNLVYQGPPTVSGSMSVVSMADNARVTLVRKTSKTDVQLSSAADRAGGDVLQIYARDQLFMSACNVGTGPCIYSPTTRTFTSDPIAGTVKVVRYDDASRGFELELTGVVLQSASTGALCEVSGRVRAN